MYKKRTFAQNPCKIRATMVKLKFYLDKRNKKRGDYSPLKLALRNNNTSAFVNTGIELMPSQWDERLEKVIIHPRRALYNAHIEQMKLDAKEKILELMRNGKLEGMSASDIKKHISNTCEGNQEEKITSVFISTFRKFISNKKKERTIEIYEGTLSKICSFSPDANSLSFEDITRDWLVRFDNFMSKTSPSVNARAIHMRNIRAVFNYAIDEEITIAYPFRKFKIKKEATRKRSLTVDQLRTLNDYPCDDYQIKYRDIFMLMFYLIGINASDLFLAKKNDVVNGRLEYKRNKTGRLYSIKIEPEAQEIIDRYSGKGEYLLNIMDTYSNYRDFLKHMGMSLKQIGITERKGLGGKKVRKPLFPDLSSYWSRHSWATIASEIDIPKEVIAHALGHSWATSTVTDIYIRFDEKKVDEANRKVIDYILLR